MIPGPQRPASRIVCACADQELIDVRRELAVEDEETVAGTDPPHPRRTMDHLTAWLTTAATNPDDDTLAAAYDAALAAGRDDLRGVHRRRRHRRPHRGPPLGGVSGAEDGEDQALGHLQGPARQR